MKRILQLYHNRQTNGMHRTATMYSSQELEHVVERNEAYIITSSCMISHTKLRTAIEGCVLPSKKHPLPLSQKDSILAREAERSFSLLAAASGFRGSPSAGPRAELSTYPAESGK